MKLHHVLSHISKYSDRKWYQNFKQLKNGLDGDHLSDIVYILSWILFSQEFKDLAYDIKQTLSEKSEFLTSRDRLNVQVFLTE